MKLSEAVDDFIARYPKATTQGAYRNALKRFFSVLGTPTLENVKDLSMQDFEKAMYALEKAHQPASVAQTASAAKQFYRHLRLTGHKFEDPTFGHRGKAVDNVPTWNVLREGDTPKLLGTIKDPHENAVVLTLAMQGWRVSEFCAMTWSSVRQGRQGWEAQFKGKGGKMRSQGMQNVVVIAAQALRLKQSPTAPFIAKPDGTPYTRQEVYHLVTKHSKAFGQRVTPHGLRATYISWVISRHGIDAAKEFAGHTDIKATQRYSRWAAKRDDQMTPEEM